MEITAKYNEGLDEVAAAVIEAAGDRRVFDFRGEMGAGKTTLISAICRSLGIEDEASSPTFSIVNEYHGTGKEKRVFHFDFYRIEDFEEALDLGLDDYFSSGALCLLEWSDNVKQFLPDDMVRINIEVLPDGDRKITVD